MLVHHHENLELIHTFFQPTKLINSVTIVIINTSRIFFVESYSKTPFSQKTSINSGLITPCYFNSFIKIFIFQKLRSKNHYVSQ